MNHETRSCPRGMGEAQGQQWYVVYTKPHREEMAQFHLQRKGLDTFFPRLRSPYGRRNRRHIVPLFPNYLFVQLRIPDDYNVVRWSPGVNHLVGCDGIPTPLDGTVVAFLRQRSTPEGISPARVRLTVGLGVRIVSGPFEGLVGIIENPPDAKRRVKVLMQLLSRQVRVEVPVEAVDGWVVGDQIR
jgi:transcriptional antiterminator RfaH